ncbi:MAG: VWA domain-containing protein [Polyangiaceae bacterium]|nr:VWA domain-containing protein [Polyangiaceae bacterium]
MHRIKAVFVVALAALSLFGWVPEARAAGTLKDAAGNTATIVDHRVKVVLNNGVARTEVTQVFENESTAPLDAVYEFPVPPDAALSQMTIVLADRTLSGQVVAEEEAESIYANEKASGGQVGLATKDGHQNFRFSIANIPAKSQATMSFVYYEPLAIDGSVGRYLYGLEDGGTAPQSWSGNDHTGKLTFELELKSALPITAVKMPGLSPTVTQLGSGHYQVKLEAAPGTLSQDLVLEYHFPSDLPRRLDVVTHRPPQGGLGTFLMVLTPGVDLPALTQGSDWVYILDVSGSMQSKLATLRDSVELALHQLKPDDRFRVITFDDAVTDLTGGFLPASPGNISATAAKVQALVDGGGTNLFTAIQSGLSGLHADRVTSTILITDAETNTGVINPPAFDALLRSTDVRVYGMLLGNNANWPLMEVISDASGGFYSAVSNEDDIAGQVQRALDKATHQALHDVKLTVTGASVSDTTEFRPSKVYQGQQLLVFGRYATSENVTLSLGAKASGKPWTMKQQVHLPDVEPDNAELERLWALDMIHAIEMQHLLGFIPFDQAKDRIVKLGVEYQLVTDYTSMIVVDDATSEKYGLEQTNKSKTAAEGGGYPGGSTSGGGYGNDSKFGGAMDMGQLGLSALLALALGALALLRRKESEAA